MFPTPKPQGASFRWHALPPFRPPTLKTSLFTKATLRCRSSPSKFFFPPSFHVRPDTCPINRLFPGRRKGYGSSPPFRTSDRNQRSVYLPLLFPSSPASSLKNGRSFVFTSLGQWGASPSFDQDKQFSFLFPQYPRKLLPFPLSSFNSVGLYLFFPFLKESPLPSLSHPWRAAGQLFPLRRCNLGFFSSSADPSSATREPPSSPPSTQNSHIPLTDGLDKPVPPPPSLGSACLTAFFSPPYFLADEQLYLFNSGGNFNLSPSPLWEKGVSFFSFPKL